MDPAPKKPQDRRAAPAPHLEERLAWWIGIYIASQIPLIQRILAQEEFNIFAVFYFPFSTGFIFAPFVDLLPEKVVEFLVFPLFFVGPIFYIWHLQATLKTTSRRRFDLLLLILVIVLLLTQLHF